MRILLIFIVSSLVTTASITTNALALPMGPSPVVDRLIVMPDARGHIEFSTAILKAQKSIHLVMYHLSDPDVVSALVQAAQNHIEIRVILDGKSLSQAKYGDIVPQLQKAGVVVRPSTTQFNLTHEKAMVIDGRQAFVTAINLTRGGDRVRDFGIVTSDASVISEIDNVFEADWKNAADNTANTPPLQNPFLIWSPVNAESGLIDLINSAASSLDIEVENLGDPVIAQALLAAGQRGVQVRLMVPQCDLNPNPLFNYPFIADLVKGQLNVKVMPFPTSAVQPYMHSKMIMVDKKTFYVGSVNFSRSSTLFARELGIILTNDSVAAEILNYFELDWKTSVAPVPPAAGVCPQLN